MKNLITVLARTILAAASLILASDVWAEPTLDPMFGDHMVLQRGMLVPIWGTADPGQKVAVSFRDQKKETTADQEGKWKVKLDPLKVGAPGKLTVAGRTPRVLSDVQVGDVWLGSGQSNMSWRVGKFVGGDEALAAMVKAGPYPNLRLYKGDFPFLCVQKPSGGGCAWDAQGNPLTRMASKFVPQPTEPNDPGNGKSHNSCPWANLFNKDRWPAFAFNTRLMQK